MSEDHLGSSTCHAVQWHASVARATFFWAHPVDVQEQSPLAQLGLTPDADELRPREQARRQTIAQGDSVLEIRMLPQRMDVLVVPKGDAVRLPVSIAPVFHESASSLADVLASLAVGLDPVVRLACGFVLRCDTGGKVESYQILDSLLPSIQMDPEGSSDFTYQINRPRRSNVRPGVQFNRVSRWVAGLARYIAVQNVPSPPDENYVEVELDINTAPIDGILPQDIVLPLFDEMIGLAVEISVKGDVP